jgi:hypothetical protein
MAVAFSILPIEFNVAGFSEDKEKTVLGMN